MIVNKGMAKFFYEQCAGSYTGHMANVPNNPTLFGIMKAHTETMDNCYAMTQTEFANFLNAVADNLRGSDE